MRKLEIEYYPNTAERLTKLVSLDGFVVLDSCFPRSRDGRFDIISACPHTLISVTGDTTTIKNTDGVQRSNADPFTLLQEHLANVQDSDDDVPFYGGAIGLFSYDLGRRIEKLPALAQADLTFPEMYVGIYDWAAVIDHQREQAWIVSPANSDAHLEKWASMLAYEQPVTPAAFATNFQVVQRARPDISFDDYAAQFQKIKNYIRDGDCYQVNYAQRFTAGVEGHPWDAYRRLRNLNAAPFSAYLSLPNATVLSSSPERFLKLDNNIVETKPIKGTMPRNTDPAKDAELARTLASSEKDRAENVMIVDLMRNDIGKTCAIGSVEVSKLFDIESFAKVHHLVSTVKGELSADKTATDLLRGCFPGGSITGAPKLRAMEIIEELEPTRRTIYCGSIGYLGVDGKMDTNIAIRTLLHQGSNMYCWAGGGIVSDSSLESEYQESLDKAAAMLDVFTHAEAQFLRR
ncbi:MAG: aminodeoxychorismate synthase component I [Pseudomonadota bacterium]